MKTVRYRKNGIWTIEKFDELYLDEEISRMLGGRIFEYYDEPRVTNSESIELNGYEFYLDSNQVIHFVNSDSENSGNLISLANSHKNELFEVLSSIIDNSTEQRFYVQNSSIQTVNAYRKLFTNVFSEEFKMGPIIKHHSYPSFWVEQIDDVRNGIVYPEVLTFIFESSEQDYIPVICNKSDVGTWKGVMLDEVVTITVTPQGYWTVSTPFGEITTLKSHIEFTNSVWPEEKHEENEDTWTIRPTT